MIKGGDEKIRLDETHYRCCSRAPLPHAVFETYRFIFCFAPFDYPSFLFHFLHEAEDLLD